MKKTGEELSVEFVELLIEKSGGKAKDFKEKTGLQLSNIYNYRKVRGVSAPKAKTMLGWAEKVVAEPPAFKIVWQGQPYAGKTYKVSKDHTNGRCGVYILYDSVFRVFYVGKASNLYAEIKQCLSGTKNIPKALAGNKNLLKRDFVRWAVAIEILRGDAAFRHDVEALLHLVALNTASNVQKGKFKRST